MLKWKIGDVTVTRVVELVAPGMRFVLPDATADNLKPYGWLAPHFVNEKWEAVGSIHTFIVESQDQRILVDTCIGNDKSVAIPTWCNRTGPFLQDLADAGFERTTIDTVLCTHLHVDHVGWNTMLVDGKWTPTFTKASYLFGREEWAHWKADSGEWTKKIVEQSIQPVLDARLETLIETNHRLTDDIWLEPTPGHTPGHVSVRISSKGHDAVITGDLMHHPCQIARPDWICKADWNREIAQKTRKNFIERFAESPTLVIGTHFAGVTAGHIRRDGDSYRFEV